MTLAMQWPFVSSGTGPCPSLFVTLVVSVSANQAQATLGVTTTSILFSFLMCISVLLTCMSV